MQQVGCSLHLRVRGKEKMQWLPGGPSARPHAGSPALHRFPSCRPQFTVYEPCSAHGSCTRQSHTKNGTVW